MSLIGLHTGAVFLRMFLKVQIYKIQLNGWRFLFYASFPSIEKIWIKAIEIKGMELIITESLSSNQE